MHLIYRKPTHNAVTAERALVNLNLVDYKKSQNNFFPMLKCCDNMDSDSNLEPVLKQKYMSLL